MTDYLALAKRARERAKVTLEPIPNEDEPMEAALKGAAVELWSDAAGGSFWLVCDEADAAKLGVPRGSVYTAQEARCVIAIDDPEVVLEIARWKRKFDGRVSDFQRQQGGRR